MGNTLSISKSSLINILKTLPKNTLFDIFEEVLIESDTSPLTAIEKKNIKDAKTEYIKGKTIKWKDLK